MKTTYLSMLIPDSVLPTLLVMSGFLMILGCRKAAYGIVMLVVINVVSPIFEPFVIAILNSLPEWAVFLLVIFIALQVLKFIGELFLGSEVWGTVFGTIILRVLRLRIIWGLLALLVMRWWIIGF